MEYGQIVEIDEEDCYLNNQIVTIEDEPETSADLQALVDFYE